MNQDAYDNFALRLEQHKAALAVFTSAEETGNVPRNLAIAALYAMVDQVERLEEAFMSLNDTPAARPTQPAQ